MQYGNGMLGRRRMYGSKHMNADEIEQIMRIQWKSLHSGLPYHEDYYYQVSLCCPCLPCLYAHCHWRSISTASFACPLLLHSSTSGWGHTWTLRLC